MATDVKEFISDLDGGVFIQKLSAALSEVAQGVINTHEKGKVLIEMSLEPMGEVQILCTHKLQFNKPTSRGESIEKDITRTPMFVGPKGKMTLQQEDQHQMFNKDGSIKVVSINKQSVN